jgi:hypothetical protein
MPAVVCPLCGIRRARRGCPALGRQICAVCCGTKRLVEIQCPADCPWLASAREHPPAAAVRQQQRDIASFVEFVRDFSERQSQLFFLTATFLLGYEPPQLHPLIDDDVAEGVAALASTFETASRGVIYDHRPASLAAERMVAGLRPLLLDAGRGAGSAFERDAAVVLRRVEESVHQLHRQDPDNRRTFLELLRRVIREAPRPDGSTDRAAAAAPAPQRLILP